MGKGGGKVTSLRGKQKKTFQRFALSSFISKTVSALLTYSKPTVYNPSLLVKFFEPCK